ncbi:MAG: hypothetical protein MKZ63_08080 [Nitrospinales bacterium]|nr:hypothetical protein [Nitrospinales bacterium]
MITSITHLLEESEDVETARGEVGFLKEYFVDFPDKANDVFSFYDLKYRCSGLDHCRKCLELICFQTGFPHDIKLRAAYSLNSFQEDFELVEETDDDTFKKIKDESNEGVKKRNKLREIRASRSLRRVLDEIVPFWDEGSVSSLLKFKAIMDSFKIDHRECAFNHAFSKCKLLFSERSIDEGYRLKLLTDIESNLGSAIEHSRPKADGMKLKLECLLYFLGDRRNRTTYRILTASLLLSDLKQTFEAGGRADWEISSDVVLAQVEIFASDEGLDIYLRGDAADVMIGYGNAETQARGRQILNEIGREGFGIYNDGQNVHSSGVEQSVSESVIMLRKWAIEHQVDTSKFDNAYLTIMQKAIVEEWGEEVCDTMETSLLRIRLITRLYNEMKPSQIFTTIIAWISKRESLDEQTELFTRAKQELEDIVNTCSTGVISRLVNILSGYDEFTIKITFSDQIKANLTGRLNAYARNLLTNCNHDFYDVMKENLVKSYIASIEPLRRPESDEKIYESKKLELLRAMADRGIDEEGNEIKNDSPSSRTKLFCVSESSESVETLLQKDSTLFEKSKEYFGDRLLLEFDATEPSRACFNLFMRYAFSKVVEELKAEFIDYVSDDEFQICVREALSFYEGCS